MSSARQSTWRRLRGWARRLLRLIDSYVLLSKRTWVAPGHFYSPIPDFAELEPRAAVLFGPSPASLPDVDVNERRQLEVVDALVPLQEDSIYREADAFEGHRYRYHPRNGMFHLTSAACLHLMLRHLRSRRVIEVGSGFTSAVMLDTADAFARDLDLTFIEPFPDRLLGLLKPGDRERAHILVSRFQEVDVSVFSRLEAGDLLFVDSSHVMKTDSDVNRLFFEIIPRLVPGVMVHFHDVYYPSSIPGPGWKRDVLGMSVTPSVLFLPTIEASRSTSGLPICSSTIAKCWLGFRASTGTEVLFGCGGFVERASVV